MSDTIKINLEIEADPTFDNEDFEQLKECLSNIKCIRAMRYVENGKALNYIIFDKEKEKPRNGKS